MKPSQWLFDFLITWEQLRLVAFLPMPNDVPTLGYGHTRGVKIGDTCTPLQATMWLHDDADEAEATVDCYVTVPLTQNQYDALCSFIYNVGRNNFVHGGPGDGPCTMLRKLNAGDYGGAAAEFPRWNKQAGVVLAGLTRRRAAERVRFETP